MTVRIHHLEIRNFEKVLDISITDEEMFAGRRT